MRVSRKKWKRYLLLLLMLSVLSLPGSMVQAASQQTTDQQSTGVKITSTTLMYAIDKVNVRKGPGTSEEVIGQMQKGDTVFAVELTEEGWYRVVFEGETGYIRQDFLAVYTAEGDWDEPAADGGAAGTEENGLPQDSGQQPVTPEGGEQGEQTGTSGADLSDPAADAGENQSEPAGTQAPAEPENRKSGGMNLSTIIILIVIVIIIGVYGAIQIIREKQNPESDPELDEEGEAGERKAGKGDADAGAGEEGDSMEVSSEDRKEMDDKTGNIPDEELTFLDMENSEKENAENEVSGGKKQRTGKRNAKKSLKRPKD